MPELPHLPVLLEPEALLPLLGHPQLLIVDLCQESMYVSGHVPGAIYLPYRATVQGYPPAPGRLPSLEVLQDICAHIGLRPGCHVVAYDDEGGGWAGRFLWLLDMIGIHRHSCLNGGIHAWRMAEYPVSFDASHAPADPMPLTLQNGPDVDKEYIMARCHDADFIVWDARSPAEYTGARVAAARAGHIPGAVNYEWTRAMDPQRGLKLRDPAQIRAELAALGITPDKEIVTHCQTHHRSGFTYLLGKILGFPNIRAYSGSWAEWGNALDTPVVSGPHRFAEP